ncbi:MAG: type II secretion system minor pseudopilin GspK [Gammaproteobacteria bacterium]|nr:type II secretion system minor pseudopilin GspK [Gammaproteobacteria bacterium]
MSQRGAALITAMLVTALAATAASYIASRQQLDIRRTANVQESAQAYLFALGVESWAVETLRRDARNSSSDHPGEEWGTELPALAVEGGVVAGSIEDQQGRFNLNNLINNKGEASPADIAIMQRLLRALALKDDLVWYIVDWLDSNEQPSFPAGAEDYSYLARERPYRCANRPMASVSELRLVEGISPEDYQVLSKHVTVLEGHQPVNVNSAGAEVLQAVVEGLTPADAQQIITERKDKPFDTVDSFLQHQLVGNRLQNKDSISVTSDNFRVHVQAGYGRVRTMLHSLIVRRKGQIRVVQRSQGAA